MGGTGGGVSGFGRGGSGCCAEAVAADNANASALAAIVAWRQCFSSTASLLDFLRSHLLEPGPAGERLGDDEPAVGDSQRQRRQTARRRATDHLGPCHRIVHRVVARAFKQPAIRMPVYDIAPGVRTNRRIGDYPLGCMVFGFGIET